MGNGVAFLKQGWGLLMRPHIYALTAGICAVLAKDPNIVAPYHDILTDVSACATVVTTLMLQWKMEKVP